MNVWDSINHQRLANISQYKKWLDVTSSHFSFIAIDESEMLYKHQKKIARKALEEYRESGNYLLYLSLDYFYQDDERGFLPIFLMPILPELFSKKKIIHWNPISEIVSLNQDISSEVISFHFSEIEHWLNTQENIDSSKIVKTSWALYFNNNAKTYIQNDLRWLKSQMPDSEALRAIFHEDIKPPKISSPPYYLSFAHVLPMDYSQAVAIQASREQSIVISGPPGTGKSQTIVNIAVEEIRKGKSVAILSQKKAAIEVISQRWSNLGLSQWMCDFTASEHMIEEIEHSFLKCVEYQSKNIVPEFNLIYYQHAVRVLEDYYQAASERKKIENSSQDFASSPIHDAWTQNEAFLKWISPHPLLIRYLPSEIQAQLDNLFDLLHKLNVHFEDHRFDILRPLQTIFPMILNLDMDEWSRYRKAMRTRSPLDDWRRKHKLHQSHQPPQTSNLYIWSEEKLQYLKEYLPKSNFWSDWINKKASILNEEAKSIYPQWNHLHIWEKLEEIENSIRYRAWDIENKAILKEINDNQWALTESYPHAEVWDYIHNKLKSKLPEWHLVNQYWIKNKEFQSLKSIWKAVLESYQALIHIQPSFQNFKIEEFKTNYQPQMPLSIPQMEWERWCSEGRPWTFIPHIQDENPVLKNYSLRDIAHLRAFVTKHYKDFQSYHLAKIKDEFALEKSHYYQRLITSRKSDVKLQRDVWKKNTVFIQKNWSRKRTKPSSYQYIRQLDTSFFIWLKPLFLGTLEQFSQYIPLEKEIYDTLIVDESSQVEMIDLIPALYRAKKVIIVGDRHQLTPMRFFRLMGEPASLGYDSILELAEEKLPIYQLCYHYRSQYRDLITYSNHYFYASSLYATPLRHRDALQWIYCKHGVYQNRCNEGEAQAIVESLKLLMTVQPLHSVGIITFSVQQREKIEETIDKERVINADFHLFMQRLEEQKEYFFVRSIEHVQGDERDIILISSGYGPNKDGHIYQYFGPILSAKGENRLNVIMSRARVRILFFSSMTSSNISIHSSRSKGLILFKKLFEFMEHHTIIDKRMERKPQNYWEYFFNPFRKSIFSGY